VKKREATEAAWQSSNIGRPGQTPAGAARDMATGSNRVVLGPRPQRVVGAGGDEEEMADVDEEEEAAGEARHVMMAEIETGTRTMTDTKTETET